LRLLPRDDVATPPDGADIDQQFKLFAYGTNLSELLVENRTGTVPVGHAQNFVDDLVPGGEITFAVRPPRGPVKPLCPGRPA